MSKVFNWIGRNGGAAGFQLGWLGAFTDGGLSASGFFTPPVLHNCRMWGRRPHWHGFLCLHVTIR